MSLLLLSLGLFVALHGASNGNVEAFQSGIFLAVIGATFASVGFLLEELDNDDE